MARAVGLAATDEDFQALVATATVAGHRGEFVTAAAGWRQAVRRYPLHPGYWARLGEVLYEQTEWVGAEIAFRTAMALGDGALAGRLARAVECGGGVYDCGWAERVAGYWRGDDADLFATPPTRDDVADAIELLCDRGELEPMEIRDLMAGCATRRELLARLLGGEECRRYHALLFKLIAETGWGG